MSFLNDLTKRGVPGVPLAALDAIPDQNVKLVLRSIIDGWHVRNGVSGDGNSRFVTAAELNGVSGELNSMSRTLQVIEQGQNGGKITSSEINRIINDIEASVMSSQLWQELGTRITLINEDLLDRLTQEAINRQAAITEEQTLRQTADTSLASKITTVTASVNQNAAAIQDEATARVNGDNAISESVTTQLATVNGNISALQTANTTTANNVAALSQALTTLQATVGENTAAIQTEATTRVNADNDIYAKYAVKIDVNGYVSGYGLISTANNSTPTSDFIVRADRFAIGTPSGPGITPSVPFTVLTTTDAKGNPPGVYIKEAMIRKASITQAYIGDASVNTLQIAGQALFASTIYSSSDAYISKSDNYLNQKLIFDFVDRTAPVGGGFMVNVVFYADNTNTVDSFGIARLLVNGDEICRQKFGNRTDGGDTKFIMPVMLAASALSLGANRIQLYVHCSHWRNDTDAANTFYVKNIRTIISASKR